jgi:ribosome-binding factor A
VRGQHLSSLIDEAVTTDRARHQGDEDDTEPSEETR